MGQTLTHGVYLPDEGERNCYNGLAANWQILDNSVGTIAAHTAALAGKAPLVHTHTKSDITDFPVYGNAAGTICEGNDSRLSDARTPVAHTHTKSDVTDLLNSNFIPSANNSYSLGSSSYQWNNLYAKNYYYNGTEFQNKFATLDTAQTISANKNFTGEVRFQAGNVYHIAENPSYVLKSSTMQEGVVPSDNRTAYTGNWLDKNSSTLGYNRFVFYSTASVQTYEVSLRNKATNGSFSPSGSLIQSGYQLSLTPNGNSELKIYAHTLPSGNGVWNLGDSTHKWKTLNGINPGALSLPDYTQYEPINFRQWNTSGSLNNTYTPDKDGWLFVNIKDTATNSIFIYAKSIQDAQSYSVSVYGNGSQGYSGRLSTIIPVIKGITYAVVIKAASVNDIYAVTFFPALGNV